MVNRWLAAIVLAGLAVPGMVRAQAAAPASAAITTADEAPRFLARMEPNELRASKMIGQNVYDRADRSIAELSELVLDKHGKVTAAVLAVGGLLGLGRKRVGVPFDELKFGDDD